MDNLITIAMATLPHRLHNAINVIYELLPYCDRFCICFNGFDDVPSILPKSKKIVAICANDKNGIKDLGCLNKMYWLGDFQGYYITVDDDIGYPKNFIHELVTKLKFYDNSVICSFHGHIYRNITNGKINFNDRSVFNFFDKIDHDIVCHRLGMGVAICHPATIGINKSVFLSKPKNFGDDEITAIWALKHNIPLIRIASTNVLLINHIEIGIHGLCTNKSSILQRKCYLEAFCNWKLNTPKNRTNKNITDILNKDDISFRIIIPTYNVKKLIRRCIESIEQQYSNYNIVIVDDASTDGTLDEICTLAKNNKKIKYVLLNLRVFAGGCRNVGMQYFLDALYTIFVDSDDYLYENYFSTIVDTIHTKCYPDCINIGYNVVTDKNITHKFINATSVNDLINNDCIAPWRKCIKTTLVLSFLSNRRKYNDVILHLKQCDNIDTVVSINAPLYAYTNDSTNSAWHGYEDDYTTASLYYVIADLLSTTFNKDICNLHKKILIKKYKKQLIHYIKND